MAFSVILTIFIALGLYDLCYIPVFPAVIALGLYELTL